VLWIGTLANGVCIVQIGYGQQTEPFYMREFRHLRELLRPQRLGLAAGRDLEPHLRTGEKNQLDRAPAPRRRGFSPWDGGRNDLRRQGVLCRHGNKEDPTHERARARRLRAGTLSLEHRVGEARKAGSRAPGSSPSTAALPRGRTTEDIRARRELCGLGAEMDGPGPPRGVGSWACGRACS